MFLEDLDNEYSDDPYGVRGPIPKTGSKVPIQDLHPEFWSKNLHSDASPYTSDREVSYIQYTPDNVQTEIDREKRRP